MQTLGIKPASDKPSDCHAAARFMHDHNRRRPTDFSLFVSGCEPFHRNQVVDGIPNGPRRWKSNQEVSAPILCRLEPDLKLAGWPDELCQAIPCILFKFLATVEGVPS